MQNSVEIARTPKQILEYVSSPTRWHEWHPYPVSITAAPGSLSVGSEFEYVGGRAGNLSWTVVQSVPGRLWQARARGRYGLEMNVTYECVETPSGARFVRTLEYQFSGFIARIANQIFLKKRITRDSCALVERLGAVAEEFIPKSPHKGT